MSTHQPLKEFNRLRSCDLLVFFILCIMIGSSLLTNFYVSYHSEITKADVEQVYTLIESNPIAKLSSISYSLRLILSKIILPGFLLGNYFYFRKRISLDCLEYYTLTIFFFMMFDFFNDLGVVLGVMV